MVNIETILKEVDKLDKKGFDIKKYVVELIKTNKSSTRPYHNTLHCLYVLYYLIEIYNKTDILNKSTQLDIEFVRRLFIAAIFHDIGYVDITDDSTNIFISNSTVSNIMNRYGETLEEVRRVQTLINTTQYPYHLNIKELNIYQRLLRESDMLSYYLYGDILYFNILGLQTEFKTVSVIDHIDKSINFWEEIEIGKKNNKYRKQIINKIKKFREFLTGESL